MGVDAATGAATDHKPNPVIRDDAAVRRFARPSARTEEAASTGGI